MSRRAQPSRCHSRNFTLCDISARPFFKISPRLALPWHALKSHSAIASAPRLLASASVYAVALTFHMAYGTARILYEKQSITEAEYKARSILVTGGAGFIASHLVIYLVQRHPEAKVS